MPDFYYLLVFNKHVNPSRYNRIMAAIARKERSLLLDYLEETVHEIISVSNTLKMTEPTFWYSMTKERR